MTAGWSLPTSATRTRWRFAPNVASSTFLWTTKTSTLGRLSTTPGGGETTGLLLLLCSCCSDEDGAVGCGAQEGDDAVGD
jgi:hypothetical protein